jgi:ribosome-binding factor A
VRSRLRKKILAKASNIRLLGLAAQKRLRGGDVEGAYASRSLATSPSEVLARIALATAEVGERDFSTARQNLEPLFQMPGLDPENRSLAQTLMGDVLDGEADYAAAFRFYSAAKEALRTHYAHTYATRAEETAQARNARLRNHFSSVPGETWRVDKGKADTETRAPVFLTGFLRSGTTLLGQVLAGHSDVEVMHERDCLVDAVSDFVVPQDGLDRLVKLDQATIKIYVDRYWAQAREYGQELQRGVFVDKAPTMAPLLPLAATLFPRAKALFLIRDPRDVVLSYFRRRFAMNAEKFDMLTLSGIAATYVATMELAELYRAGLGLDIYDVRYETLTSDFEPEVRRICEFLGLEWHPAMADFGARVKIYNIDTPNIAQLTRGLSRESEGHWRRYKKELMPILHSHPGASVSAIRRTEMSRQRPAQNDRGPSQRQLRVGEMLRHALSQILVRCEIRDPDLEGVSVTVTQVKPSPDMRHANVFVEPLGGKNAKQIVTALNRHKAFLRGEMGRMIELKFTPELRFLEDESFSEAQKIEDILKSERVQRDLKADDDGT